MITILAMLTTTLLVMCIWLTLWLMRTNDEIKIIKNDIERHKTETNNTIFRVGQEFGALHNLVKITEKDK